MARTYTKTSSVKVSKPGSNRTTNSRTSSSKIAARDAERQSKLRYKEGQAKIDRYKAETKNIIKKGKYKPNMMDKATREYDLKKTQIAADAAIKSEMIASGAGMGSGALASAHDLGSSAINNNSKSSEQLVQGGMSGNGQFGRDPESDSSGKGQLDKPITEYSM